MKKFSFNLRSVETVRSIRELRAREVFSAAVAAQAAAQQELLNTQARVQELEGVLVAERSATFRPADQVSFINEYVLQRRAEQLAVNELAKALKNMEECRERWIACRRDVRVIEKLETKARERHRLDCEHEEQSIMDDRVNSLVGRASLLIS